MPLSCWIFRDWIRNCSDCAIFCFSFYVFVVFLLYQLSHTVLNSAGFTYRLNRLKPSASKFKGPPSKVYNFFNIVNGLSHLCCHNVPYFLNNPSVVFLTQLHSISEYCRILKHPSLSSPLLKLIKHTSIFLQS